MVVPTPDSLITEMFPPMSCTRRLQMDSPSPAPWWVRV